jgi:hypothetical protein
MSPAGARHIQTSPAALQSGRDRIRPRPCEIVIAHGCGAISCRGGPRKSAKESNRRPAQQRNCPACDVAFSHSLDPKRTRARRSRRTPLWSGFGSLRTAAGTAGFPEADISSDPILPESGRGTPGDRTIIDSFLRPVCECQGRPPRGGFARAPSSEIDRDGRKADIAAQDQARPDRVSYADTAPTVPNRTLPRLR